MEKYSSYKDSGVKWLGEIPSHWETIKSKYIWQEQFATSENGTEELLSVSQYDGVTPSKGDSRSESLKGYKIVKENDLVINIMLAWLGGLGVSKHNGIVSPAYCTYKMTGGANPHFLHYLYKTPLYLSEFARHSTGVVPSRWRMYTDDFGQVLTLLPPKSEQNAIASYLDSVTTQIDVAISQQQKMIELLNERKQIIINNAVTKGLDPNVKMKDSGVDWIGEIPEGWEVRSLKTMMSIQRGHDLTAEQFNKGDFPVYGSGGLMGFHDAKTTKAPSIVIGRSGSVGKLQYVEEDFWAHNTTIYLTDNKGNDTKYLYYLLKSIDLSALATQTAVPTLDRKNILSYKVVCCLDYEEQHLITRYLEFSLSKIDSLITSIKKKISLLQERKQIIINEVVTGKVKVS